MPSPIGWFIALLTLFQPLDGDRIKKQASYLLMKNGKVVVVGDGACGKTCMLEVFKSNQFPEEYIPTVVDNFVKEVKYDGNRSVTLTLWDTAGQEDYDTIRPLSYRETDLVLLCYTIEHRSKLGNIEEKWLAEVKNYCPNAKYILVGLKEDLREDEEVDKSTFVSEEEGRAYADKIRAIDFVECSAKTRKNVDLVFEKVARHIGSIPGRRIPRTTCCPCFNWCNFGCC